MQEYQFVTQDQPDKGDVQFLEEQIFLYNLAKR
jgi:hypothetical protein